MLWLYGLYGVGTVKGAEMTRDELLKKICPWGTCDCGDDYESCNCDDCNRVLEEWLDEYDKQIRAKAINDYNNELIEKIDTDTHLNDAIKKILDNIANEMYCKGIDDFVHKCDKHCGFYTGDNKNLTREDILFIANELKEQNK